jgi:glutathione S-transferase
MSQLQLTVLSLRYSSWSMRPWLALTHAGADFKTVTVELPEMLGRTESGGDSGEPAKPVRTSLSGRRALGSVHGLFPVLRVDGAPIHESLAICEYVAESFPGAELWPANAVERARARAISCEMVSGFSNVRNELSSHFFARVPDFSPSEKARTEISRVFEIWSDCLDRSGGPFLFGSFGIADAMYFPMLGRFRTYGVAIPDSLAAYTEVVDAFPAVTKLIELARREPRIPVYDDYIRGLGGDPDAALASAAE